jgi:hypothetical protein
MEGNGVQQARTLMNRYVSELVDNASAAKRAELVGNFSKSGGGGSGGGGAVQATVKAFDAVISRVTPLFNKEEHEMCSALYMQCISEQVAALKCSAAQGDAAKLEKALDEAARKVPHKDKAVVYRHAMDAFLKDQREPAAASSAAAAAGGSASDLLLACRPGDQPLGCKLMFEFFYKEDKVFFLKQHGVPAVEKEVDDKLVKFFLKSCVSFASLPPGYPLPPPSPTFLSAPPPPP